MEESQPAWLPRDKSNDPPLPSDVAFTLFLRGCDPNVVVLDYRAGLTPTEYRYLMNDKPANG